MDDTEDWGNILYKARVAVTDSKYFNAWYGDLSPHMCQIVDDILDHNVTPEMIAAAQNTTDEEWENMFVQALGNGTTDPTLANDLTDIVLGLMLWSVGT